MGLENYQDGSNYRITNGATTLGTGTWKHVVMTQTGTDHPKFYYDGALVTNSYEAALGTPTKTSLAMSIGRYGDNSAEYFDGIIDDVRFWDRVLSASEVSQLYDQTS
jgi:hypothetical protein